MQNVAANTQRQRCEGSPAVAFLKLSHINHSKFFYNKTEPVLTLMCIHVMFNARRKRQKDKHSSWAYPGKLPNISPISQTPCFLSCYSCQEPIVNRPETILNQDLWLEDEDRRRRFWLQNRSNKTGGSQLPPGRSACGCFQLQNVTYTVSVICNIPVEPLVSYFMIFFPHQ